MARSARGVTRFDALLDSPDTLDAYCDNTERYTAGPDAGRYCGNSLAVQKRWREAGTRDEEFQYSMARYKCDTQFANTRLSSFARACKENSRPDDNFAKGAREKKNKIKSRSLLRQLAGIDFGGDGPHTELRVHRGGSLFVEYARRTNVGE